LPFRRRLKKDTRYSKPGLGIPALLARPIPETTVVCKSRANILPTTSIHPVAVALPLVAPAYLVVAFWVTFARGETSLILAVVTLIVMVLFGLITTCGAFARNVRQDRAPTRRFREFLNGEVDVETGRICGRVAFREIATMPFMVAEYDDTSSVSHVALAKSQTKAH
jgi:hypothetical protein